MDRRPIRTVTIAGDAVSRGGAHGRAFSDEIRRYAGERLALSGAGTDLAPEAILELADRCLPAHRGYAPDLYEEMTAMAAAAGISPAEAVVLGGYTDFYDVVRACAGAGPTSDNCTAVVVPPPAADAAGLLAQTWDMDRSATPHVVMLDIRPDRGPSALVFSITGCLGQIGMNEAGVGVGINNLTAADGTIGVTWPFVVRRALQQTNLDDAVACVLEAELAGGHSYLLLDSEGRGAVIEAMPTATQVFDLGEVPLIHTNHCLAAATMAVEGPRPPHLAASSRARLEDASRILVGGPITVELLMRLTSDTASICRAPQPPEHYETSGAVVMRPATGDMWACWGQPAESEFERFVLGSVPA